MLCMPFFFFSLIFYNACIALSDSDSVPEPDSFPVIIREHITMLGGNLSGKPVLTE